MIIITSWMDIFGVFGLSLDSVVAIINCFKSKLNVKTILAILANLVIIFGGLNVQIIYYITSKYIIGHIRAYLVNKKMNEEFAKAGLEAIPYWPVFKLIVVSQIKALFTFNPYKELHITI